MSEPATTMLHKSLDESTKANKWVSPFRRGVQKSPSAAPEPKPQLRTGDKYDTSLRKLRKRVGRVVHRVPEKAGEKSKDEKSEEKAEEPEIDETEEVIGTEAIGTGETKDEPTEAGETIESTDKVEPETKSTESKSIAEKPEEEVAAPHVAGDESDVAEQTTAPQFESRDQIEPEAVESHPSLSSASSLSGPRPSRFASHSTSSSSDSSSSSERNIPLSSSDPHLKTLSAKPKMASRYRSNVHMVNAAMNKSKMENRDRLIGLGGGLTMTEDQLYEIARKRVQPLLKDVDELVEKQNAQDDLTKQDEHAEYTQRDEHKVSKMLGKYKKQLGKQNDDYRAQHSRELADLNLRMERSAAAHKAYLERVQAQIVTDKEEAEAAEEAAKKQHSAALEHLVSSHETTKEVKTGEIESAKLAQTEETEKAAEFETEGQKLAEEADEKEGILAAKKKEVEELLLKLQGVIDSKQAEAKKGIDARYETAVYEQRVAVLSEKRQRAASNEQKVQNHLALLVSLVDKHTAQVAEAEDEQRTVLPQKRKEAIAAKKEWEELQDSAKSDEAKKQELVRIEKQAEQQRLDEEAAEARQRAVEQHQQEIADSKLRVQQQDERIQQQKLEQKKLKEEMKSAKKLNKLQSKHKKLFGFGLGLGGAAVGAAGGAAIAAKSATSAVLPKVGSPLKGVSKGIEKIESKVSSKEVDSPKTESKEVEADLKIEPKEVESSKDPEIEEPEELYTPKAAPSTAEHILPPPPKITRNDSPASSVEVGVAKVISAPVAVSSIDGPTSPRITETNPADTISPVPTAAASAAPPAAPVPSRVVSSHKSDSSEATEDSLDHLPPAKPVFMEEPQPVARHATRTTVATGESQYDEVITYETISKEEYEAHKGDPDYLLVKR